MHAFNYPPVGVLYKLKSVAISSNEVFKSSSFPNPKLCKMLKLTQLWLNVEEIERKNVQHAVFPSQIIVSFKNDPSNDSLSSLDDTTWKTSLTYVLHRVFI